MSAADRLEREIFDKAVEIEKPDERAAYVQSACGGDSDLTERIIALLRAHDQADFLPPHPGDEEMTLPESPLSESSGTTIGCYKLLEKIGEGGMAVVYMAEQEEPIRRKVALKIIKLGMDTKSVVARFEAERQALAMMDHPNIAKVLDAGATETGRPYFVMDLVPGLPITEYCDKNRLSIKERLRLFILTCNSVQHAHQKGIIHRDVKPSNVMVTQHDGRAVPKVIDFGIAKATNQRLTEKTLFTRYAHIIGTPAYMSPEQAELSDLDIDTRTDIYSLGVLLYELLTGTTPFSEEELREAGYLQMQKIICEEEPTKPSTKLSTLGEALTDVAKWHSSSPELMPKMVRGDLDWIVMKSLEKDRSRRYTAVSELAADIQRHLNSEPVQAGAPTVSYKLRKFIRRNRVAVVAGSLVAAALLAVAVVSAMYAHEATLHAREAAIHANEAEDARQNAVKAKQEISGLLAGSYVDRAQALCEQGEVGRGMLWLADSLKLTPDGTGDLGRAVRTSLAAWHGQLHSLRGVVQYPPVQYRPLVGTFTEGPVGTYTMTSSGKDIWYTADQFHFAYRKLTGPGSIVVRVDNVEYADDWAKAGVMIRETLDAGSKHVLTCVTPAYGVSFQCRVNPNAACIDTEHAGITAPHWVKLERDAADNFTASHSANGTTWESVGNSLPTNIPMNANVYVGLALTSHDETQICEAVFSNVRTTGSVSAEWAHQDIGIHANATDTLYPNQINAVTFSPDGSRILAACLDGSARFCDGATGQPIGGPLHHGSEVLAVAISPDGTRIATGGKDGSLRLWDAVTLKRVGEPMQHKRGRLMAFSPDGSRLVTAGDDGAVQLWDAGTGKSLGKVFQYESEGWRSVQALAICPDGLRVVLAIGQGMYQMFDTDRGEPIGPPVDNTRIAHAVAIRPDGTQFATGDGAGTIRVWDAATGEQALEPILHGGGAFALAFSADGSRIVSGGVTRMALLWDAATGEPIGAPMRQRDTVRAVAFSPDGTRLVTGNQDGVVRIWDLIQGKCVGKTAEQQGRICGATFVHDGLWVLTQIDGVVQFRDATTGKPIGKPFSCQESLGFKALSPDSSRLVTRSRGYLSLWDVASGRLVGKMVLAQVRDVTFNPDGSRILTGGQDSVVRLWDAATLTCLGEFRQHQGTIDAVAFSPDGSQFLTGSYDGTTQLWDADTLEPIGKPLIHQSEVKGGAFSPDGTKILIGFADGTIRLWHTTTLNPIGTPMQHVKLVTDVAFSPDGSQLLACSIGGTARLWDAATLKPIGPTLKHNCGWPRASFSPDGSQILLYGQGRTQVWKAPPGPLEGSCERIVCSVQVVTGMELDPTGGINVLDVPTWQQRRRRLQELAGPP
ncbi:MAG: protein kinase domain-containing protein [Planctomycetota bacterium]